MRLNIFPKAIFCLALSLTWPCFYGIQVGAQELSVEQSRNRPTVLLQRLALPALNLYPGYIMRFNVSHVPRLGQANPRPVRVTGEIKDSHGRTLQAIPAFSMAPNQSVSFEFRREQFDFSDDPSTQRVLIFMEWTFVATAAKDEPEFPASLELTSATGQPIGMLLPAVQKVRGSGR